MGYFPREESIKADYLSQVNTVIEEHEVAVNSYNSLLNGYESSLDENSKDLLFSFDQQFSTAESIDEITSLTQELSDRYPNQIIQIGLLNNIHTQNILKDKRLSKLENTFAGEHLRNSYFAKIGKVLEPIFYPLGWDWKITMATLAAFPAREVIIATIGTIYNLGGNVDEESNSLVEKMRQAKWEDGPRMGSFVFTPAVALSIMVFFALCCQCGATLVTIRKETASWWYAAGTFIYMTVLAYVLSLVTYQFFSRIWY